MTQIMAILPPGDTGDCPADVARSEQEYLTRLRAALAALHRDPLSIPAANAVRALL